MEEIERDEDQCTIQEYHDDTEWVNHSAKEYVGDWVRGEFIPTPEKYKAYIDGLLYAKTTPSQEIGTVFHTACEGKKISDIILIGPGDSKAKKEWKDWKKTLDPNETRPLMKASEARRIVAMYDNMMAHPKARQLVEQLGEVEKTVKVVDNTFGLKLKCRLDYLLSETNAFVDYKTTDDPSPQNWLRHARDMGVIRQAAFYKTVLSLKTGEDFDPYHIVVGSKPPHSVCVYQFHRDDLQEAFMQNHVMLKHIMTWAEFDMWEPEWANEIIVQRVPGYKGGF